MTECKPAVCDVLFFSFRRLLHETSKPLCEIEKFSHYAVGLLLVFNIGLTKVGYLCRIIYCNILGLRVAGIALMIA